MLAKVLFLKLIIRHPELVSGSACNKISVNNDSKILACRQTKIQNVNLSNF